MSPERAAHLAFRFIRSTERWVWFPTAVSDGSEGALFRVLKMKHSVWTIRFTVSLVSLVLSRHARRVLEPNFWPADVSLKRLNECFDGVLALSRTTSNLADACHAFLDVHPQPLRADQVKAAITASTKAAVGSVYSTSAESSIELHNRYALATVNVLEALSISLPDLDEPPQTRWVKLDARKRTVATLMDTWSIVLPLRIGREDVPGFIEAINCRLDAGQVWRAYAQLVAAIFWTAVNAIGYLLANLKRRA